ncbi:MAG TPA: hypothetical protein VHZ75_04640 [Solirubrobacteraceae bacterium]|nr:hypothetical protein [Solirubrobacteraceae bacterium]
MPRNLIDEIVRRRLWPLVAVAALVALAAPLLFLHSAPQGAPTADTAAPAAPATAKLPARAARLLATSDDEGSTGHATGSSHDPLLPPASYRAAAAVGTTTTPAATPKTSSTSKTKKSSKSKPIPVVIQNADGSSTTSGSGSQDGTDSTPATPANPLTAENAAVDIRFGKGADSPLRTAIPKLQALFIRGKVAAVFVKYSPSRRKAVFAVAPGIHVSGPVACRVENGVCRFLDIPAGSYARLTMLTSKREVVRRRLDVAHITRRTGGKTTAGAASTSDANVCFLHKLEAMTPGSALVDRSACER